MGTAPKKVEDMHIPYHAYKYTYAHEVDSDLGDWLTEVSESSFLALFAVSVKFILCRYIQTHTHIYKYIYVAILSHEIRNDINIVSFATWTR